MKIALISDIHGNFVSLEAVLNDLAQIDVDCTVCLGDFATLGPQPHEVIIRMQEITCAHVMGNHDSYLLDPTLINGYMKAPWFAETVHWCLDQLSSDDMAFLGTLKTSIEIPLAKEGEDDALLLCVHGSPYSNTDLILATTPEHELDEMLNGIKHQVIVGGHTHIQMMRQHNGMILVNTGSVGLPFERANFGATPRILPWAEYAILEWVNGRLSVNLRRVPINMKTVKEAALDSTMPDRHDWVKNWITL